MKIAVCVDDSGFSKIDLSHPEKGNPGVGGTIYEFAMLLKYFPKITDVDVVTCFHKEKTNRYSDKVYDCVVDSLEQLAKKLLSYCPDLIILRNDLNYARVLEGIRLPFILWAHNFLAVDVLPELMSYKHLRRIVFVGKEQYDRYIDHPIIRKCTYVYNMVGHDEAVARDDTFPAWVTYTGSLKREKGFHILAKHWKEILKSVPEAQLHVIGSGQVYDRSAEIGRYGISDEIYEKRFVQYLLGEDGRLLPSVFFHGIMGVEKEKILRKTSVGVVNPTAETETFCISAVEMSQMGIPIVTKRAEGFLDTVPHGVAGLTFMRERELPGIVVKLLKNREYNKRLGNTGKKYVSEMFSVEKISQKWHDILVDALDGKENELECPIHHLFSHGKWIRIMLYYGRRTMRLDGLPSIQKMNIQYIMGKLKLFMKKRIGVK